MIFSIEQIKQFNQFCDKVLNINQVRYIAIVNTIGRAITEKNKANLEYFIPDEKIRLAYMQWGLDLAMRKELTENLGSVEKIVAYRDKINIVTLPFDEYFVMLSIEKNGNIEEITRIVLDFAKKIPTESLKT